MGLRPSPRAVWLLAAGIAPALFSLFWDGALAWVVGWDAIVAIAFAVDAVAVSGARLGDLGVTRQARARMQQYTDDQITLSFASTSFSGRAIAIDEPPPSFLPRPVVEIPVAVRLAASATSVATYAVRPTRRGDFDFGPVNLIVSGPLGLAARRVTKMPTGTNTAAVLPRIGDLEKDALDPALLMAELGIKRVRKRAEGTEFESLRDAVPEDELRRIDWRASARRGRPIARNYELEKNHDVLLCVDTGRLMGAVHAGGRSKIDHAIGAALRLAAVALKSGDRVGLLSFDVRPGVWVPPDRGRAQLGRLLDAIYGLDASVADASFTRALIEVRRRQKKRALIVFLTDFVDAEASSAMIDVLGLLAARHAVLFVALRDPEIRSAADAPAEDLAGVYRSIAAMGLDDARHRVVESIRARGVEALDLVPDAVTAGAIRAYLALRAAERV